MTPLCFTTPDAALAGHYHGAVIEVSPYSLGRMTAALYSEAQLEAARKQAFAEGLSQGIEYASEYRRLCAQLIVSEPA